MNTCYLVTYLFCFIVAGLAETSQFSNNALVASTRPKGQWSQVAPKLGVPSSSSLGRPTEVLDVLDIVLVASVDGKFHALNRTSGNVLWSMGTASSQSPGWNNGSFPSTLGPLIRTSHIDVDPDVTDDDSNYRELYIIEPQSGEIFVMSTPASSLQRLPFTMMQLVDMSPFSFSGDEDRRVFVGRKETSLMLIELETGKLKEINSECPWDMSSEANMSTDELDALEDALESHSSTEIFIGRTDYHVTIHTRPLNAHSPKLPIQNLSFSVYGPNNKDSASQIAYKRSVDDVYVQSLPNGEVFSFQSPNHDTTGLSALRPIWHSRFSSPIVATFDVVRSQIHSDPFVLLQPRPHIEDTVPNVNDLPNRHLGHVGLIDKSLFAITPKTFPLIAFGDSRTNIERDYASVDDYTEARKLEDLCGSGGTDRRCALGPRHLEDSKSWNRLLDAPANSDGNDEPKQTNKTSAHENTSADDTKMHRPSNGAAVVGYPTGPQSTLIATAFVAILTTALWFYGKLRFRTTSALPAIVGLTQTSLEMPNTVVLSSQLALPVNVSGIPANGAILNSKADPKEKDYPFRDSITPSSSFTDEMKISDSSKNAAELDESDFEDKNSSDKRKPVKRNRRGGRGKKKKDITVPDGADLVASAEDEKEKGRADESANIQLTALDKTPATPTLILPETPKMNAAATQLIVSDNVLGYGSHGTVVYSGSLQGRSVAVKRLLHDFVTLASREVSILQDADDHPNVIRYYYQEAQGNFLYIALELCPASLGDVIERPNLYRDISASFEPKRALEQVTAGLRHLHSLKIIHRDIKPQNILVSAGPGHRMLISDFGLCKKLDFDQTSFLPTAADAGTVGWRAPEILRGDVKLDEGLSDENASSRGGTVSGGGSGTPGKRLTKLVDIFALGCLFYYVLTNGGHPFGDRYEREVNIMKGAKPCLKGVESERFGEEGAEASALIFSMLEADPKSRPDTSACLLHPYFWDPTRRLAFLQDASDRFEIMCRDPKEPDLLSLEVGAREIVGLDWHTRLDRIFVENLGKFRKYDGRSVQDLMRALRNKKHHYQDLPEHVKRHLGPMPDGYLAYFTRRFPKLFLHVHSVVACTALRHEPMFKTYFTLQN